MGTHAKITKARKSFLRKPSSPHRKKKLLRKIEKYHPKLQNDAWKASKSTKGGMLKIIFAQLTRDQTQAMAKNKAETQERLQRALLKGTREGTAQSVEDVTKLAKTV